MAVSRGADEGFMVAAGVAESRLGAVTSTYRAGAGQGDGLLKTLLEEKVFLSHAGHWQAGGQRTATAGPDAEKEAKPC